MKATVIGYVHESGQLSLTFKWRLDEPPPVSIGQEWELTPPGVRCKWAEDEDGYWHTDCKHSFVMIADAPHEYNMRFCCLCGNPLEEVKKP